MKYTFELSTQPRSVITVTGLELSVTPVVVTPVSGTQYSIETQAAPRLTLAITGDDPLVATPVAVTYVPPTPSVIAPRFPADCPFQVALPSLPDGPVVRLSNDVVQYVISQSNMTLDLNGHRINVLTIADNVSRVRITNGTVGTVGTRLQNNGTAPALVTDVTIDRINFVGGNTVTDGNGLRIARLMIAGCSSIAATTPTSLDGMHTCVLWLDPGSSDVLVQDCDFWTRGREACFRLVSSKRTIVHTTKLGCRSEKHCYRVHGNNGTFEDSWISDCELRNRGMMIATLPDSTGPQPDVVRRTYAKRLTIRMNQDGMGGADASFGFPPATLTPTGVIRLQTAVVEGLTVFGSWDAVSYATQLGAANPQLGWTFRNNAYVHV